MIIAALVCAIVAFCFKDALFGVILAPQNPDFITYRLLQRIAECFSGTGEGGDMLPLGVRLINTGLAQQFLLHVKTSAYVGLMLASPYIIYLLFRFVSPALYDKERRYAVQLVSSGYVMFVLGILLSYSSSSSVKRDANSASKASKASERSCFIVPLVAIA